MNVAVTAAALQLNTLQQAGTARATRRQERERVEREREADREAAAREFQKTAPLRLLQLMAKAERYMTVTLLNGVTGFDKNENGPLLRVSFERYESDQQVFERTLYLVSDQFDFEYVEGAVQDAENAHIRALTKQQLARETWDALTPEQREALGLTRRP